MPSNQTQNKRWYFAECDVWICVLWSLCWEIEVAHVGIYDFLLKTKLWRRIEETPLIITLHDLEHHFEQNMRFRIRQNLTLHRISSAWWGQIPGRGQKVLKILSISVLKSWFMNVCFRNIQPYRLRNIFKYINILQIICRFYIRRREIEQIWGGFAPNEIDRVNRLHSLFVKYVQGAQQVLEYLSCIVWIDQ